MVRRSLQLSGGNGMNIRRYFVIAAEDHDVGEKVVTERTIATHVPYSYNLYVIDAEPDKVVAVIKQVRRLSRGRPKFKVIW